jgi:VanZ family protein
MPPVAPLSPARTTWLVRGILGLVILVTAVYAFSPPSARLPEFSWDKADHFCAFFALTSAAVVAFPRRPLLWVAISVSLAGAGIELVQALPAVHRDCDVWDWVADNTGIAAVVGVIIAGRLRTWLAAASPTVGGPPN